jgi:hypothetical protein
LINLVSDPGAQTDTSKGDSELPSSLRGEKEAIGDASNESFVTFNSEGRLGDLPKFTIF